MRTAVLAVAVVALAACRSFASSGDFDDDGGQDGALPPDVLVPDCDPRRFDDCPAGQKCSYVVDPDYGPTNRCVDLHGSGVEGESCVVIGDSDDCGNHRICWAIDGDGDGVCVGFCNVKLECASMHDVCSVSNDGLLPLCLLRCDPLVQDCPTGWGCYPDSSKRWTCDLDRSGAAGAHGDACECINCCAPGLVCVSGQLIDADGCRDAEFAGCCGEVCTLDGGQIVEGVCPTEAERCEPFPSPTSGMISYANVGICRR
jgi:hypothetical protein